VLVGEGRVALVTASAGDRSRGAGVQCAGDYLGSLLEAVVSVLNISSPREPQFRLRLLLPGSLFVSRARFLGGLLPSLSAQLLARLFVFEIGTQLFVGAFS
jgi:hypothetical protein